MKISRHASDSQPDRGNRKNPAAQDGSEGGLGARGQPGFEPLNLALDLRPEKFARLRQPPPRPGLSQRLAGVFQFREQARRGGVALGPGQGLPRLALRQFPVEEGLHFQLFFLIHDSSLADAISAAILRRA